MSTKANPTLIGVFVLGAIVIAIGAVVFFGSADLFAKKQTYVSYFTQSISGLSVGSNVKFKGVNIGKVTQILLGIGGKDQPGRNAQQRVAPGGGGHLGGLKQEAAAAIMNLLERGERCLVIGGEFGSDRHEISRAREVAESIE